MTPDAAATRRPAIVGNWKLWGTRAQAAEYCERLLELLPDESRRPAAVGICAPFTSLGVCVDRLEGSGVAVYAQNMHQEDTGAFTGEVSAPMLREVGADGVVLGHSERRTYFAETDAALAAKLPAALDAGLRPILCVGETEAQRDAEETEDVLRGQVEADLANLRDARLVELVIAYEPVWAIGTGRTATPEQADGAIGFIRSLIASRSEEAAAAIRIVYGGSVTPDNAAELLGRPEIDGALVGGASLHPEGFASIVAAAAAAAAPAADR
jgi:triosephosphate isomerase (TIM)